MEFEHDRDSLEYVFTNAMTAFGQSIARDHFGKEGMDWNHSGGEMWDGSFAFDFRFSTESGEDATFQVQIVAVRNMEPEPEICTECGCELTALDDFERGQADGESWVICRDCFNEQNGSGCPECARSYGPNYTGPCDH